MRSQDTDSAALKHVDEIFTLTLLNKFVCPCQYDFWKFAHSQLEKMEAEEEIIARCDELAESFRAGFLKVLDPILWSTLHFSTPLRPNHRRHTFTTAATVCLGCGLSLNVHSETYQRIGL